MSSFWWNRYQRYGRKPLNCLVIGCGAMGTRRARILAGLGHVVMCADADSTRAATLAYELQCEMVPDVGLAFGVRLYDAVFISTWPVSHVELALQAVRSGAHVFIEKPLALSEDGLDELEREAEAHGVKVMVGCNWRFHPAVVEVRQAPRPEKLWVQFCVEPTPATSNHGGGLPLDMGSHALDLARYVLGPVTEIQTRTDSVGDLILDSEHGGEREAFLLLSYRGPDVRRVRAIWDGTNDNEWELAPDPIMYEHETEHFLRAIETGAPHMNPLSEARDTLRHLLGVR